MKTFNTRRDELNRDLPRIPKFEDPALTGFAEYCLDKAPKHFWEKPSSSSGKFHPPDENQPLGLALHTHRTLKAAEVLILAWAPKPNADIVRLACLFHDIARYGLEETPSEHSLSQHPEEGANFLLCRVEEYHNLNPSISLLRSTVERAAQAVASHMGKWGYTKPKRVEDYIVHLADMVASQYY